MKKLLLSGLLISASFVSAQTIISENFNSLTPGNLATDVTGNTAGQNGWFIYSGSAADYQIATIDATHGNSLKITSGADYSSSAATYNRFAFKSLTAANPSTNSIIKVSFDIYTGPATGAGGLENAIFNSSGAPIAGIFYDFATKKIVGVARLAPITTGTAGTYNITLGTSTFAPNTWVSVSYSYNKTTGAYTFTDPDGTFNWSNSSNSNYTVVPNLTAVETDFINVTSTGNTTANTVGVDNFVVAYNSSLATSEVNASKNDLLLYPNPATDAFEIKTSEKVLSVSVLDVSGRIIPLKNMNDTYDVTRLNPGTYIIQINTANGQISKKLIKK